MLTLVLTRHGLTDRSTPEQHIGQRIDVSINDQGRKQAEALARRLAPVAFDRVITSPLFRARETAEILARGTAIEADPRLREMDYGAWEGRTYDADRARPTASTGVAGRPSPDQLPCPGGESGNDVAVRVRSFLEDLLDEHRAWHAKASFRAATSGWGSPTQRIERPVLAVAHATTNRILICVALAIEIRDFRRRLDQDQANLTVLHWELEAAPDEGRMLLMNDTAHLRRPDEVPWA